MNKEIVDVPKTQNLTCLEALQALKEGKEVEFSVGCKIWNKLSAYEHISRLLDDDINFRIKPNKREVVVNGKTFYAENYKLGYSKEYFVPDVIIKELFQAVYWTGSEFDIRALNRGIVFLNKEDAIGYAKAVLGLD